MFKFDNFDLSQYLREEYDGKEFDMVEQVGDWEGYDVHLGYTQEGEYILLSKVKKAGTQVKMTVRQSNIFLTYSLSYIQQSL